ncbi:MAG: shikimate dehydrogenase [Planctomycetes bacterium]|nr:shikimate dehydrogenase [Planctomycetota bacterium]
MTYAAVSIASHNAEQFAEQFRQAKNRGAEAIEVRLDGVPDVTPALAGQLIAQARKTKLPVIATCREKDEGGARNFSIADKTAILAECIKAGAEFVDCELKVFSKKEVFEPLKELLIAHPECRLILSAHRMKGRFEDINLTYETMLSLWPMAICKLVYTARHINDCFEAMDLQHRAGENAIVFCMGQAGLMTRVRAKKLGAFLTFASLDEQSATAPGQISISQMKHLYRWDKLDAQTELFGLIGNPVGHSLSPALFNAAFEHDAIDALYLPFLVEGDQDQFSAFVDGMVERSWLSVGGFSVTLPHKTHALDYVNRKGEFVDTLATAIGAANTLKVGFNGIVCAYNTDYAGALDALTSAMGISPHALYQMDVAVVGAGGVARAVVAGLVDVGASVTVYNRTVKKAESLAEEFRCKAAGLDSLEQAAPAVVINCTSLGMCPDIESCAVPKRILRPEMTVFDTVYNPIRTRLLEIAAEIGANTVSGAEMFIRQAIGQYRLFVGSEPDEKVIRSVVFESLQSKKS